MLTIEEQIAAKRRELAAIFQERELAFQKLSDTQQQLDRAAVELARLTEEAGKRPQTRRAQA